MLIAMRMWLKQFLMSFLQKMCIAIAHNIIITMIVEFLNFDIGIVPQFWYWYCTNTQYSEKMPTSTLLSNYLHIHNLRHRHFKGNFKEVEGGIVLNCVITSLMSKLGNPQNKNSCWYRDRTAMQNMLPHSPSMPNTIISTDSSTRNWNKKVRVELFVVMISDGRGTLEDFDLTDILVLW